MTPQPPQHHPIPAELPRPWGPGPIVLIDDDHLDLRFARRCHARSGIARPLLTFDDAGAALEYLGGALEPEGSGPPSVVIIDFMESRTPGPSGLDMLAQLRRQEPRLPVVVMTASSMESFRRLADARGCAAYIRKTTRLAELVALFAALGP